MIKAEELRIGNWITDRNDFHMQVVSLGSDYMYADFEGNEGDVWEFNFENNKPNPIPLTEEILLKCGFEKGKGTILFLNGFYYDTFDGEFSFISIIINNIKYLHQLQNLHYILTGQELEVKL